MVFVHFTCLTNATKNLLGEEWVISTKLHVNIVFKNFCQILDNKPLIQCTKNSNLCRQTHIKDKKHPWWLMLTVNTWIKRNLGDWIVRMVTSSMDEATTESIAKWTAKSWGLVWGDGSYSCPWPLPFHWHALALCASRPPWSEPFFSAIGIPALSQAESSDAWDKAADHTLKALKSWAKIKSFLLQVVSFRYLFTETRS